MATDALGRLLQVAAVAGVGYCIYSILNTPTVSGSLTEAVSNWADDVSNEIVPGTWAANGQDYIPTINQIEAQLGIPTNLLARLAYQESHWRADVITGAVVSSAGAVGMFQLLPQYFPGAGQSWTQDAMTAGQYLQQQYATFKDWGAALAAYNDGPANLSAYLSGSRALPQETIDYVTQITADVPVASPFAQSLNA